MYIGPPETPSERAELLSSVLQCCAGSSATQDDVPAAIQSVSSHPRCAAFTSADLKSVITTAYLSAVNELVHVKCSEVGDRGTAAASMPATLGNNTQPQQQAVPTVADIQISGKHIWDAFMATEPSISIEEAVFYQSIYGKFR